MTDRSEVAVSHRQALVPRWYLDELTHAGPEHLDRDYVRDYDAKAGTDPQCEIALLRDLGLTAESILIDLGAGTGSLALAAARVCARVIAVDVSTPMLEALSATARRDALTNVECVAAGMLTYRHQGRAADFAYSRNALHHIPDFWKALALQRVAAMLAPGGMLRLSDIAFSFDPAEAARWIEEWLAHAPEQPKDGWTRSELETHLRDEHSTFTWLLEPMLERAGFEITDASYSDSHVFAAYVCRRR